jgi:hypothetical protein
MDTDIWGVRRREVSYGSGSYNEIAHYPVSGGWTPSSLAAHRWPDPSCCIRKLSRLCLSSSLA